MNYVTYDENGKLTGAYIQALHPDHVNTHIEVSADILAQWYYYKANSARDGVVTIPPQVEANPADVLALAKLDKKLQVNAWREQANNKTFPHNGKHVAIDALSTKDLMITTGHIALFGTFPDNWPGGWKYTDNTYEPMPTIEEFKLMYKSLSNQGTNNFSHSQALKALVDAATNIAELDAIVW